jgi:CII-binding regulator of phage lambda lysogenization HflD
VHVIAHLRCRYELTPQMYCHYSIRLNRSFNDGAIIKMSTTDILDEFLEHISNLVLEMLKKRGARRTALVDILLKKVHSKIIEKEIEAQKMSLNLLVLEHKLAKNCHAIETIALLKEERDQLATEKHQWVKLRELYGKRLALLDTELAHTKARHVKET